MGSPLSPVVANKFMENVENIVISTFLRPPKICKRYVDDTFVILSKYAARSSNINEAIQFTVKGENEKAELPSIDCLIKRNSDGTLGTTVYRKPTNTGRYLNFHSCYSSATEQVFIKGFFLRVERLCSTPDLLKTEMERIYSQRMNNSYPKKLIARVKPVSLAKLHWNVIGRQLHSLRSNDFRSDPKNAQS